MRGASRPPADGIGKRQPKGKQSSTRLPVSKTQPDKTKMPASKKTGPSRTVSPEATETSQTQSQSQSQLASITQSGSPEPVKTGTKRKEREFEHDTGRETNIRVIVRCRGRNEREIKENSGVVVSTSGVKGDSLEVCMGPNALGNKTYHFDRVFSPAADQAMVYDEVVTPMLEEVKRVLSSMLDLS